MKNPMLQLKNDNEISPFAETFKPKPKIEAKSSLTEQPYFKPERIKPNDKERMIDDVFYLIERVLRIKEILLNEYRYDVSEEVAHRYGVDIDYRRKEYRRREYRRREQENRYGMYAYETGPIRKDMIKP